MHQTVGLFLLLISPNLAENEVSESFSLDSSFCYQDICNDAGDPESILRGPVHQLGNFEECLYRRKQQYCLANIQLYPGDAPSEFWFHIQNMTAVRTHFRRDILYVGICAPESSTAEDVSMAMVDMLEPAAASLGVRAAIKVEPRNCQTRHQRPITTGDVVFGAVLLTIVAAVIAGTVYDSRFFKKECDEEISTVQEVLLCFSLIKNWKKIEASRSSRNLTSIEGIRIFISFVAILMHRAHFILIGALANMEWLEEAYRDRYQVMLIHVHTHIIFFICISGFLTGYNASRQMDRGEFTFLCYIKMVGHRLLRYIPIYVLLIAFSSTWLNYFGSGPFWPSIATTEVQDCRQNWWLNVLFLNNYINADTKANGKIPNIGTGLVQLEMLYDPILDLRIKLWVPKCMFHTWYIASDFQNYVVFLFALVMIYKYQNYSRVITGFLLFTVIIIPFLQTYIEKLDPTYLYIPEYIRYMKENPTVKKSYITFHGNAAPYFVGVIFGCIAFKMIKEGTTFSKASLFAVWVSSFVLPIGSMFTFYEFYRPEYEYNVLAASVYAALHKPIYALGVGSILLGCSTGHGWIFRSIFSWRRFQAIAPFTYGIYLTHFILQRISAGNIKEPVTISMNYFMSKAVVDSLIAFMLSVVLQLCVQLPVENLFDLKTNSGAEMLKNKHYFSVITTNVKNGFQKILRYK